MSTTPPIDKRILQQYRKRIASGYVNTDDEYRVVLSVLREGRMSAVPKPKKQRGKT